MGDYARLMSPERFDVLQVGGAFFFAVHFLFILYKDVFLPRFVTQGVRF